MVLEKIIWITLYYPGHLIDEETEMHTILIYGSRSLKPRKPPSGLICFLPHCLAVQEHTTSLLDLNLSSNLSGLRN
jgi:hypothetical protein